MLTLRQPLVLPSDIIHDGKYIGKYRGKDKKTKQSVCFNWILANFNIEFSLQAIDIVYILFMHLPELA